MSLLNYLNKYFPNGSIGEYEGKSVDIKSHFLDKFGVNVKVEDDLYLFKYDQLLVKFTIPLTKECRGHIYQFNGKWNLVCNAMDKFWNYNEGFCPIFNESDFNTYINQIELKSKEDGSLIHLYYVNGDWKVSTSGTITPLPVMDSNLTFTDLFWNTLGQNKETFTSQLDKNYTYIFELCSRINQIVSLYSTDRVYLLNIRHTQYGTYLPIEDIAKSLNLLTPKSIFLYQLNISKLSDLIDWVESNCKDDSDCKNKEGYVGYINGIPSFKIKNNRYKFLHSFKGNNEKETRNNIIDAFFSGSLDDVYNELHESSKIFADSLQHKVNSLVKQTNEVVTTMTSLTFNTQKEYALFVMAHAPKLLTSFFFSNKESILKNNNVTELLTKFLKEKYKSYLDYWKE